MKKSFLLLISFFALVVLLSANSFANDEGVSPSVNTCDENDNDGSASWGDLNIDCTGKGIVKELNFSQAEGGAVIVFSNNYIKRVKCKTMSMGILGKAISCEDEGIRVTPLFTMVSGSGGSINGAHEKITYLASFDKDISASTIETENGEEEVASKVINVKGKDVSLNCKEMRVVYSGVQ